MKQPIESARIDGRVGMELYDHTNDPLEYRNLAKDPAHAEQLAELRQIVTARR